MTHKEKKAMVERLQKNEKATKFLKVEEVEFLNEHPNHILVMNNEGQFCEKQWSTYDQLFLANIYRLSPDFQLPEPSIEPPEGYRIVSMDDRKRCKYPVDCEVKFRHKDCPVFIKSTDRVRWQDPLSDLFVFAVPADYVFAEDRPKAVKQEARLVEYPIIDCHGGYKCEVKHARDCLLNLHELPSIVGFAGVKFEGSNDWFVDTAMLIRQSGAFRERTCDKDSVPATPIAARFYVKGANQ